ncbi:MAG TPA: hypothetical protein H9979_06835 [Candidatus Megamonas gallistercoris]|nr:hypothetical protein [Candidatus Megamonas gallistercoris]
MRTLIEAELSDGVIYGDNINEEYVYMPASEIGMENPVCIFETTGGRQDITMEEALKIVTKRSLKPVRHPRFGLSSC